MKTSCTKTVWIIIFHDGGGTKRTHRVAANDFLEVLSYYTEEALLRIISVLKQDEEVTHHY